MPEEKKVILLNAVGPSTYRLIKMLSFEDTIDQASAYFSLKCFQLSRGTREGTEGRRVNRELRGGPMQDSGVL